MAASRSEALADMRATYQDVLDAPAHQIAEIVNGTLYAHPRPAPAHTLARSALGTDLGNPFQFGRGGPGGGGGGGMVDPRRAGAPPRR